MKLTVIIHDATNQMHMQEPVTHRSIQVTLTAQQVLDLRLKNKNEGISFCFIEPVELYNEST